MKLLFDENVSSRLVKLLTKEYPESTHIDLLNMQGTTDTNIWDYAQNNNYTIVSKDNDFRQRSFYFGCPPKIIWLSVGNSGTKEISELLLSNSEKVKLFINSPTDCLLVLSFPN
ncbi:MAG: DUF5615 family PIN-like protein [Gammaproteobacteria bacterium]|nr:DUF5615 family PIN-like protein [Gammaproteobacteria bacterium]